MPPGLRRRVRRVDAHHPLRSAQLAEGDAERRAQLQTASAARLDTVRQWRPRTNVINLGLIENCPEPVTLSKAVFQGKSEEGKRGSSEKKTA